MQTKLNVLKFAATLRGRMKELQAQHKKDIAKYNKDVASWKVAMNAWLREIGPKHIERITMSELQRYDDDRFNRPGFSMEIFFAGAPRPPKRPETKQINDIRNTLRHLAITGRDQVTLDTTEVGKLLGVKDAEDDD